MCKHHEKSVTMHLTKSLTIEFYNGFLGVIAEISLKSFMGYIKRVPCG